jgi:GNAT superfamily N-acetyltransferase
VDAIVVTGTIGAGKTAVAEELSLILDEWGMRHALIDVDGLGQCYPGPPDDPFEASLSFENLAAVWPNFRARGIRYAIIAHLIERADELDELRAALPGADLRTVLVVASPDTCERRLRRREISESMLEQHLRRSPLLGRALEGLHAEDFRVSNEGRPIREVATEVVERLGWTPPARSVD